MIKQEAGIRINPNEPTRTAEIFGRSFSLSKYSENLKSWFNRSDNYYRTGFSQATINANQIPSAVLKILNKNSND